MLMDACRGGDQHCVGRDELRRAAQRWRELHDSARWVLEFIGRNLHEILVHDVLKDRPNLHKHVGNRGFCKVIDSLALAVRKLVSEYR